MATSHSSPLSARFDQFEVDLSSKELRKWGVRVPVQEQPFHLLRLLLEAEEKSFIVSNCETPCGRPTRSSISSTASTQRSANCGSR